MMFYVCKCVWYVVLKRGREPFLESQMIEKIKKRKKWSPVRPHTYSYLWFYIANQKKTDECRRERKKTWTNICSWWFFMV